MKKSILRFSIFSLLSVAVYAPLLAQESTTSPSFSLSDIPQVAVEARVSKLMPTKAMDGFTEVPQVPFSEEGKIGLVLIEALDIISLMEKCGKSNLMKE